MSFMNAKFIYRHGQDDFSLWIVQIDKQGFQKAMRNTARITGQPQDVLQYLPVMNPQTDTNLYCFFSDTHMAEILSVQVDQDFVKQYYGQGNMVRGNLQEIVKKAVKIDNILLFLTPQEASIISSLLDLELCNCVDNKREKVLSTIYDSLQDVRPEYSDAQRMVKLKAEFEKNIFDEVEEKSEVDLEL